MSRSLVFSLGLFALVAALTFVRPPEPSHPQFEFNTPDGLTGQVLLNAQPSAKFCRDVGKPVPVALRNACPSCQISSLRCLSSLSEKQQRILDGRATEGFSVQLSSGVMLLQSDIPELARGACEEVAKRGLGACLEAGQALTAPLSPIALMARGIDVTAFMSAAAIPLLTSLFISLLIVISLPIHGRWTADHPGIGIQKLHTRPVPRVGGLALVAGAALPLILHMLGWTNNLAPTATDFGRAELSARAVLEVFVLASMPAFLFGLSEDLTRRVGVRERLLATMASALLAWWLTGLLIQRLDLAGLDALMSITALSLAFTVVAVSGVSNAINIIDGVHGLASGIGVLALVALGLLAWMVGDETLASVAAILAGATAGFFLLNYPFGRIFLGDSGAYVLGFWVAWMSVMLVARNPDVSPWACLLIVVYPVTEVLYSAQRRFAAKRDPGQPDREHLHSLVKVKWARVRFGKWGPEMQNAAVAPCLLLFASVPMVFAVLFHDARGMLIFASLVFVLVYSLLHRRFMAIPE